ncbi:MAG: hypothetical protein AAF802_29300, partial [Planctomycetota bacterium]
NRIQLAESEWESGARRGAYEKGLFLTPRSNASAVRTPAPITRQAFNPSEVQNSSPVISTPIETTPAMVPMESAPAESEGVDLGAESAFRLPFGAMDAEDIAVSASDRTESLNP